jgi:hypothetical protein
VVQSLYSKSWPSNCWVSPQIHQHVREIGVLLMQLILRNGKWWNQKNYKTLFMWGWTITLKRLWLPKRRLILFQLILKKNHAYEGEIEIEREENEGDNEYEEDEVSNDASLNGSTFNLDNLS